MAALDPRRTAPAQRRKQQRSLDTRDKIFRAALSEFALLGFEGASTRRIAEVADMPHSLVLYHFNSKENLWSETVDDAVRRYTRFDVAAAPAAADGDPVSRLKVFFCHYIRFSAEYPDFFRMLTHENTVRSERLNMLIERHTGPTLAYTTDLIRQAQATGAFVDGDPLQLMYLFLGAATSPYRSAREIELLTGVRPDTVEGVEQHIALIERLFFRTPAKGAGRGTSREADQA